MWLTVTRQLLVSWLGIAVVRFSRSITCAVSLGGEGG